MIIWMQRILLVEDNVDLRESLVLYLETEGFFVRSFHTAEDAESILDDAGFDIAVIDINLPGMSGFDLIKEIRDTNTSVPLIALTARDSVIDKVRGFETGLTDYIVKPFSLAELTARIRAHLRATSAQQSAQIITKHLVVNPGRQEILLNNQPITLTATEFRLLACLARNNGNIVPSDDLIAEAWGEAERYSNPPLRIHMRNIRKKLASGNAQLIKTKAGTGYMMDDVWNNASNV